jgi:hypothetical protein
VHPIEAFAMISVFGITGVTLTSVARAFFNRPSKRVLPGGSSDPLLQERLDRLESAIQAIAIETERIAEGQRFTTKLLSQAGTPSALAPLAAPLAASLPADSSERRATA